MKLARHSYRDVELRQGASDCWHDDQNHKGWQYAHHKRKRKTNRKLSRFCFGTATSIESGFIAKFGVIKAAATNHSYAVALVAMVASVIAALLYLRIMISMWLSDAEAGDEKREAIAIPVSAGFVVAVSAGFTLLVGVWPSWLIDASQAALQLAK